MWIRAESLSITATATAITKKTRMNKKENILFKHSGNKIPTSTKARIGIKTNLYIRGIEQRLTRSSTTK